MSQSPMAYTDKNEEDRNVLYAEIARLRAELEKARNRAQTAADRCDEMAKERPISVELYDKACTELEAAREAIRKFRSIRYFQSLGYHESSCKMVGSGLYACDCVQSSPAVRAAVEGKR